MYGHYAFKNMYPTADDHGTVPKSNQQRAKMIFIVHPLAHCLRDTRAYCLPRCSLPPVVTAAKPRLPQSIDRPRAASPQLLPAFRRCGCLHRLAGGRPQPSASSISAPHRAQVPLPASMPRPSPAPFSFRVAYVPGARALCSSPLRLFGWARAVFFSLRFIGWACGLWGWVSKWTRRWGAVDGRLPRPGVHWDLVATLGLFSGVHLSQQ